MKKFTLLLTFLTVLISTAKAQIPNASFETWTTTSSNTMPDSWDNLNPATTGFSVYTCERGTNAPPHGASYLKLTTKLVVSDLVPGIAVCGKIDMAAKVPKSGFPYSGRPANLTGKHRYVPGAATDTGYIGIWLTKWNVTSNKRDTIASKMHKLTISAIMWTTISIPLTYTSGNSPDSALIGMSSSGLTPAAGSYLYVDSMNFDGSVASVPTTTYTNHDVKMFPNPARGYLFLDFGATLNDDVHILVMDVFGRVKTNAKYHAGQQVYDADVGKLAAGIYYVMIQVGEDLKTQKLVIL